MNEATPETIGFDDLARLMGKAKPVFVKPIRGLGKRIVVPLVFKFGDKVAEFFCEAVITDHKPCKPEIGFTDEDVTFVRGVTLYASDYMDRDEGDTAKPDGEVLFFEDFAAKYVDDAATRAYLHRKMDELEDAVRLDEETLESVNGMYMNREVGERIYDPKLH